MNSVSAGITITEEKGWLESSYIKWSPATSDVIDGYNVYVKETGGEYTKLDDMLVRAYSNTAGGTTVDYYRADALGLKAGTYQMKVVGTASGSEAEQVYAESGAITVEAHDRSGFAFTGDMTPGAYNADGTLKANAKVLYVTKDTAKTVSTTVTGANSNPCVGLQSILAAYEKGKDTTPIAIRFIGLVTKDDLDSIGSSAEGLQIKGKAAYSTIPITLEGVGDDASIFDFGFLIKNTSYLEMRNLGILKCIDDGVSIDTKNSYLWIHNLDIFYGYYGSGDHAKGDGSTDMKDDSKYLTLSYIHYWDTGKCVLCGMKSESGPNYITFHHNWFDHSDSRHPRIRTMSVHIYNNYYDGNSKYGVGVTTGADAFVENNYFRNCKFPMLISLQGNDIYAGAATSNSSNGTFSSEAPGSIKAYNNFIEGSTTSYWPYNNTGTAWTKGTKNSVPSGVDTTKQFDAYEVSSRSEKVPESIVGIDGKAAYSNFDTDSSIELGVDESAIETPQNAKATVMAKSGRMNGGDFKWTFTEADDTSHDVDANLKAALLAYKSALVKVLGNNSTLSSSTTSSNGNDSGSTSGSSGTGGTTGSSAGEDVTVTDSISVNFTGKKNNNETFFTITGNYANDKGSVTVNGETLSDCLKIETATSVKFTTSTQMTLTLVFKSGETGSIKIDGTNKTSTGNVLTEILAAGEHTLTKKDSRNLFYIGLSE